MNLLQAKIEKTMNINTSIITLLGTFSNSISPESKEIFDKPNENSSVAYFEKLFNYVSCIHFWLKYIS